MREGRDLEAAETITCPSSSQELGILLLPSPFRMLGQYLGIWSPRPYYFMARSSDRQDPQLRPEGEREKWRTREGRREVGEGEGDSGRQIGSCPKKHKKLM